MGSAMSALLETASGTPKKAQDGQGAAQTATGATEKKQQGEPSTTTTSEQVRPHNFSEIVAKAQGKDGRSSDELLEQVLSKGIYLLDGNTIMKYWAVDYKRTNSKANCFMLLARGLSIIWGSDQRYWSWRKLPREPDQRTEETAGDTETDIEVACLEDVCWLEIRGCLEMSYLSPGVTYDVAFVAKLAPNAYGWSVPVDLQLKIPNGTPKQRKVNLWRMDGKKNKEWTELKVGEVEVPPASAAAAAAGQKEEKVEIAMLRLGGEWKSGLELMGIMITPHQLHQ